MKTELLSQSFLRGFIYVLTLGLVSIPTPARTRSETKHVRETQTTIKSYAPSLAVGLEGLTHDFEILLHDSKACLQAYNKKRTEK